MPSSGEGDELPQQWTTRSPSGAMGTNRPPLGESSSRALRGSLGASKAAVYSEKSHRSRCRGPSELVPVGSPGACRTLGPVPIPIVPAAPADNVLDTAKVGGSPDQIARPSRVSVSPQGVRPHPGGQPCR